LAHPEKKKRIKINLPDYDSDDSEYPPIKHIPDSSTEVELITQGILEKHTHFLTGEISDDNISRTIQWIIFEHAKANQRPSHLTLYINSRGGDLYGAFALIDIMRASAIPIQTIGIGNVASAAAMIFSCGTVGRRYIAKNTGFMMHQFSSDLEGKEHELAASMKEFKLCRVRIHALLKNHCGIRDSVIREKLLHPSDVWLSPSETIKYKLADKILKTIK